MRASHVELTGVLTVSNRRGAICDSVSEGRRRGGQKVTLILRGRHVGRGAQVVLVLEHRGPVEVETLLVVAAKGLAMDRRLVVEL